MAGGLGRTVVSWWVRPRACCNLPDDQDNQGKVHSAWGRGPRLVQGVIGKFDLAMCLGHSLSKFVSVQGSTFRLMLSHLEVTQDHVHQARLFMIFSTVAINAMK